MASALVASSGGSGGVGGSGSSVGGGGGGSVGGACVGGASMESAPFFIIANNGWAGLVYKHMKCEYNVPFVNVFVRACDFVTMCTHLDLLLAADLSFLTPPPYPYPCPIASLSATLPDGSSISTHLIFVHYKTEEEVLAHWNRRVARIRPFLPLDKSRVLLKMDDRDGANAHILRRFHELNAFPHKVSFGSTETPFIHPNHVRISLNRNPKYVDDGGRLFRSNGMVLDWNAMVDLQNKNSERRVVFRCPRTPRELLEHARYEASPYHPLCGAETRILDNLYTMLKRRCSINVVEHLNAEADD
ncbi:hypothetical protein PPROV_001120500 [Pycnococcus provasolii]|uniref:Uncharacterized protein n=1 Tax=Pycnococcus provasolii TaxID=41880 RepID=A0A830I5V9_9CHLO|nr:hypothetical protein PPROV_001120500 [Pycnococcus provasolii]